MSNKPGFSKEPRLKLHNHIPESIYQIMLDRLNAARAEHPSYRDDELLILLWSKDLAKTLQTRKVRAK